MINNTDITIRKAVFSDATAITGVQTDTWKVSYKNLVPEEILAQKTVSPERIAQFEKCINEDQVWVAEKNDCVVGFLTFRKYGKTAEIEIFYILPEYQRRGIGGLLFEAVTAELRALGCRHLTVWTLKSAPSVGFYQKIGGQLSGRIKVWKYDLKTVELIWNI